MQITTYIKETAEIASKINLSVIEDLVSKLVKLRSRGGSLFLLGVGVSAGNCGHAVNDFRKLCGIEAYSSSDNASELTVRINDEC